MKEWADPPARTREIPPDAMCYSHQAAESRYHTGAEREETFHERSAST
jgi:hypothetical protein